MHEMSIAASLLAIVREELERHDGARLTRVCVKYGRLSQLVPDSLTFAWEVLTKGTPLEQSVLELEEVPLLVACSDCGLEFQPEEGQLLLMPCPACGEDLGHKVLSGKEMYLDHIEVDA